jgi:flavin reductase (DIM6/NTAB) family NADH-FMN oxidoreductase RutF
VQGKLNLPLLPGTLTALECSRLNAYPGGDHRIFTGLVEYSQSAQLNPAARPLLYSIHTYGTFTALLSSEELAPLPDQKERSA